MLEGVTLAEVVKFVVKVLVNLAAGTIFDEETAENAQTAHPDNLAASLLELEILNPHSTGLHTLAYGHRPYPSSYQNHDVYRFFVQL